FKVLCGLTGTGKTYILQRLALRGAQVLDLENLATHRGSLLGEQWQTPQPTQKYFESQLLSQLQCFDFKQPVWVEAESNQIGRLYLPQALWQQITQSDCVEIQMPLAPRIQWLLQQYPHLTAHPDILKTKLHKLKFRYGRQKLNEWFRLIDAHNWEALVTDLLQSHYDPTYAYGTQRYYTKVKRVFTLSNLSSTVVDNLVDVLIPNAGESDGCSTWGTPQERVVHRNATCSSSLLQDSRTSRKPSSLES
ncbi:MAG TPA: hypothetical protein V6D03_15240, partial [Candidatus Caenarcaniphilales bacterium]